MDILASLLKFQQTEKFWKNDCALLRQIRLLYAWGQPPYIVKSPSFRMGFWRRRRDSNPRYAINVNTISNRAPSTTQPLLHTVTVLYAMCCLPEGVWLISNVYYYSTKISFVKG